MSKNRHIKKAGMWKRPACEKGRHVKKAGMWNFLKGRHVKKAGMWKRPACEILSQADMWKRPACDKGRHVKKAGMWIFLTGRHVKRPAFFTCRHFLQVACNQAFSISGCNDLLTVDNLSERFNQNYEFNILITKFFYNYV